MYNSVLWEGPWRASVTSLSFKRAIQTLTNTMDSLAIRANSETQREQSIAGVCQMGKSYPDFPKTWYLFTSSEMAILTLHRIFFATYFCNNFQLTTQHKITHWKKKNYCLNCFWFFSPPYLIISLVLESIRYLEI